MPRKCCTFYDESLNRDASDPLFEIRPVSDLTGSGSALNRNTEI